MKRNKDHMVLVMARSGADLDKLSSSDSPMKLPCENVGRLIAQAVLDGNGKALIPMHHIRIAIDTNDGVHAILDNFDLTDPHTKSPLLFALLMNLEDKS
jgi:hypothetical protein